MEFAGERAGGALRWRRSLGEEIALLVRSHPGAVGTEGMLRDLSSNLPIGLLIWVPMRNTSDTQVREEAVGWTASLQAAWTESRNPLKSTESSSLRVALTSSKVSMCLSLEMIVFKASGSPLWYVRMKRLGPFGQYVYSPAQVQNG